MEAVLPAMKMLPSASRARPPMVSSFSDPPIMIDETKGSMTISFVLS